MASWKEPRINHISRQSLRFRRSLSLSIFQKLADHPSRILYMHMEYTSACMLSGIQAREDIPSNRMSAALHGTLSRNNSLQIVWRLFEILWDRLLSEFCFTHGVFHPSDLTCNGLSAWIASNLAKYINGDRSHYNCHFIPQWEYAQQVEKILSFSSLKTGKDVEVLGNYFQVKNFTLQWENNGEITKPACKSFTKTLATSSARKNCVSSDARAMVDFVYQVDYEHLSMYF